MKRGLLLFCFVCLSLVLSAQVVLHIEGQVIDMESQGLPNVDIFCTETNQLFTSNPKGKFEISNVPIGDYTFTTYAEGYASQTLSLRIDDNTPFIIIQLQTLHSDLETVEISAQNRHGFGVHKLNDIKGVGIYASKKTEVIQIDDLVANLSTNNPRQVYASVPGLNIWENDGAGLQLGIGARGLDPNRTANFNTRQNGYDISADALGYPESYYTPPTEALKNIEVVRGAASLQFGPQFGGLLNFQFRDGNIPEKFKLQLSNTLGSYGFWNSFTSVEGNHENKIKYYGFYQRKQGDGWRDNSEFEQNTAFASIQFQLNPKLRLKADYTYMNYLAQQAGGLVDFEFAQNPQQSKRERNWFRVNWQLAALHLDAKLTEKTKWNTRFFHLAARREALGWLGPINRPDPLLERDLIKGTYDNWGIESRILHRYELGQGIHNFLVGVRYYNGTTTSQQGNADATDRPNFHFLHPNNLERSDYLFPSQNVSAFAENLFQLTPNWTVTPGVRWEYIETNSDGYFNVSFVSGGDTIASEKFFDEQTNKRSFPLFGLGTSYRFSENIEAYANVSQNYRSINFSDMAIVNTNLVVDSLLQDEKGYNIDLGIRGTLWKQHFMFDLSTFYLKYNNRIGIGTIVYADSVLGERASPFRTNIGNADIYGVEAYLEGRYTFLKQKKYALESRLFTNLSFTEGTYTSGESDFINNDVELIPPLTTKVGLQLHYRNLALSYQFSYTQQHFTDATNAEFFPDATRGIIPSYSVHDLSASYTFKQIELSVNVNNVLDGAYFTRRANAYPGPGIIPADGRMVFIGLVYTFTRS